MTTHEETTRQAEEIELYAMTASDLDPERHEIERETAARLRAGSEREAHDYAERRFRQWLQVAARAYRREIEHSAVFTPDALAMAAASIATLTVEAAKLGTFHDEEPQA